MDEKTFEYTGDKRVIHEHRHEEGEYVKVERNSRGFTYSVKANTVQRAFELLREIKLELMKEENDG